MLESISETAKTLDSGAKRRRNDDVGNYNTADDEEIIKCDTDRATEMLVGYHVCPETFVRERG